MGRDNMIWNIEGEGIKLSLLVGPDRFHEARLPVESFKQAMTLLSQSFEHWYDLSFQRPDECPISEDALTETVHSWNEFHGDEEGEHAHTPSWKWFGLALSIDGDGVCVTCSFGGERNRAQVIADREKIGGDALAVLAEFREKAAKVLR